MSCRAYMVWKIDCDCGYVEDLPDGTEPPDACPECDDEVERS